MSREKPRFVREHPVWSSLILAAAGAVTLPTFAASPSGFPEPHGRYFAHRDMENAQNKWQWPVMAKPWLVLEGTSVSATAAAAEAKLKAEKARYDTGTPPVVHPKTLASNAATLAAANNLSNNPITIRCPNTQQPSYRVTFVGEGTDTNAVVCLETDHLRIEKTAAGVDTVVIPMATSKGYAYRAKDSLINGFAGLTLAECRPLDNRLEGFGAWLLESTGLIPANQAPSVAVLVDETVPSTCDSWPRKTLPVAQP